MSCMCANIVAVGVVKCLHDVACNTVQKISRLIHVSVVFDNCQVCKKCGLGCFMKKNKFRYTFVFWPNSVGIPLTRMRTASPSRLNMPPRYAHMWKVVVSGEICLTKHNRRDDIEVENGMITFYASAGGKAWLVVRVWNGLTLRRCGMKWENLVWQTERSLAFEINTRT